MYRCLKPSAIVTTWRSLYRPASQSEMQMSPQDSLFFCEFILIGKKLSCFCLMYANTLKVIPQFRKQQMKTIPVIP